jgi:hypothetical protein
MKMFYDNQLIFKTELHTTILLLHNRLCSSTHFIRFLSPQGKEAQGVKNSTCSIRRAGSKSSSLDSVHTPLWRPVYKSLQSKRGKLFRTGIKHIDKCIILDDQWNQSTKMMFSGKLKWRKLQSLRSVVQMCRQ